MLPQPAFRDLLADSTYDGNSKGIYVVESTKAERTYRIGSAGGSRRGKGTLKDRVPKHCKPWTQQVTVETHLLAPYRGRYVWELPNWPWTHVSLAEGVLYATMEAAGSEPHRGKLRDNSNYVVPAEFNWSAIVSAVDTRLEKLRDF